MKVALDCLTPSRGVTSHASPFIGWLPSLTAVEILQKYKDYQLNMALALREKHRLGLCTEYMKGPSAANYPRYTDHQAIVCKHLTPEVSRDRHLPTARAHKITQNTCSQSGKTAECKNVL